MRNTTIRPALLVAAGIGSLMAGAVAAARQPPGAGRGMGHGMGAMGRSAQSVALGDSIFHGTAAGGTCFTCHGPDARGTAIAPDLTDSVWLHGDGSYRFVRHTVMHGVPQPKRYPAPMPPMGGARLTPAQVHAVAAYVHQLSRPAR